MRRSGYVDDVILVTENKAMLGMAESAFVMCKRRKLGVNAAKSNI